MLDADLFEMEWPELFKSGGSYWKLKIGHKQLKDDGYTHPNTKIVEVSEETDHIDTWLHENIHIGQLLVGNYGSASEDAGYEDLIAEVIKTYLTDNPEFYIDIILTLVGKSRDEERMIKLLKHLAQRIRKIGSNMKISTGVFM